MLAAALGAFLQAVEDGRQKLLEPFRLEQAIGKVLGNKAVQLLHWNRAALAAGLALPRFDRASVIAISPSLPGPERHGAAAGGAEADAGKEVGPLTTRAGVTFGLRARRCACTASNVA